MKTSDFLSELKAIDPRLDIIENPNRPGLSNIKLDGRDICPVPSDEIREDSEANYFYVFPNGMHARHKSREEALERVQGVLEMIKTDEGRDTFFG
jgi:hypothetical protein